MTGPRTTVPLSLVLERYTDPSTCILEYFWGDSMIYVIGMSSNGSTFRATPLPDQFADSLQQFFTLLQYPHPTSAAMRSYARLGAGLYRLLLEPEINALPATVNRLRVIPDGLLGLLPFDALPQGPGNGKARSHRELPLLIYKYRVSYAGSAALLTGTRALSSDPVECLGFAWSNQGDPDNAAHRLVLGRDWAPLPGAGRELTQIHRLVRGSYFSGEKASEATFKSLSRDYGILHLALHGNSGGEEPYIVFPEAGDSMEDGVLNLHELYDLPLQARLAVLSACETGSGAFQRGEGVMSVASGFGTAGCPSVVMSVWPVNDIAGSMIIRYCYEFLVEGQAIDEALHHAKLAFMKSGGTYHSAPCYWAPFIALGDVSPIPVSRQSGFSVWWAVLGGVVLGFLGIFLLRRKRHR
jgi:CHAT domain-containing protein